MLPIQSSDLPQDSFHVALLLYPSTHGVVVEGLKRGLVFSLARTGNVARTHSVSAEREMAGRTSLRCLRREKKERLCQDGGGRVFVLGHTRTLAQTLGQPSGVCSRKPSLPCQTSPGQLQRARSHRSTPSSTVAVGPDAALQAEWRFCPAMRACGAVAAGHHRLAQPAECSPESTAAHALEPHDKLSILPRYPRPATATTATTRALSPFAPSPLPSFSCSPRPLLLAPKKHVQTLRSRRPLRHGRLQGPRGAAHQCQACALRLDLGARL